MIRSCTEIHPFPGRRPFAGIPPLALATILILSAACASRAPYTKETFVMGTKAWVTIAGMSDRDAERAAQAAFREMYRIESVMSTWRPASEISRLNTGSNGAPFTVSSELCSLIDSSLFYSKATSGAFDVTVRPLVRLWGFQGGEAKLPSDSEIERAMSLVGFGKIVLDPSRSTITLPPGMQIDLAGIAKGYAVDRCAAALAGLGVRSALVNIGGNIYAMGAPPGEKGWSIGIRDPKGGLETVGTLTLRDEAVATSGNYENFVEIEGRRYGHVIDPRAGRPISSVLSVTVVAPTGLASDALSTGLFVLGPDDAREVVKRLAGVAALFALADTDGIVYRPVGDIERRLNLKKAR
ncbi:MAG: FAD:protein FMN transferase [Candidatus Krumholzibacteria bacterium]|nr:FAD:protein FMN transferase [Candidatus Krumholzibacteria bacterium]